MIKVLHYVGQMDIGGIESLLMSIYRCVDKDQFQFDFAVHTEKKCFYDDEIMELGGQFHRFPAMRSNPLGYKKAWDDFWKTHHEEYQVFHFHTPTFANIIAMQSAKKYGVKVIIAHCHNTHSNKGNLQLIHDIIHRYNGNHISKYANVFLACSPDAAKWGFGKLYENHSIDVEILKNGIDLSKFKFSENTRTRLRREMKVENKIVIGNVGRLCAQKNQSFLLDVFQKIKGIQTNTVLLLIGTGPDEKTLRDKVKRLGLEDDVRFLGARDDVANIMMAMDSFVFPSIYEGLGIVLIEAQAIGLHVFASKDRVPFEAKVTNNVDFIDLDLGADEWAKRITKPRFAIDKNTHEEITKRGYDILDTARRYQEIVNISCNESSIGDKVDC